MGKRFDNGVSYYTTLTANIKVNFPEDEVKCQYCPFCRTETELGRWWCRLNNQMIINPFAGVAYGCPLKEEQA